MRKRPILAGILGLKSWFAHDAGFWVQMCANLFSGAFITEY